MPRIAQFGWKAPFINTLFFMFFHILTPWNWIGFFMMTLPWALLVFRYRSFQLGLAMHMGGGLFGWMMFSMMIMGLN